MTIEAKYDTLLFKLPKGVKTKSTNVKFDIQYSGDEPERVYFMVKSDEDLEYQYLEMQKTQNGYSIEHFFEFSECTILLTPCPSVSLLLNITCSFC